MMNLALVILFVFFSGCVNEKLSSFLWGAYKDWEVTTEDQVLLWMPAKYHLSETERKAVVDRWLSGKATGLTWCVNEGTDKEFFRKYKEAPLEKKMVAPGVEVWTYPYAFVYFKGNRVNDVKFRWDEIEKVRASGIPIEAFERTEISK